MNKIVITQTKENGLVESNVPNSIVTKLYNIGKDDDANQTITYGVDENDPVRPVSTISGAIQVAAAYNDQLQYVAAKYPNLDITPTSVYISFADSEVESVLLTNSIGDGVGVTTSAATTATIGTIFRDNTDITSFNEFGYFTKANNQPSSEMFKGCTNLSSIDQSNITKLANRQFYGTGLTTVNMPSLQSLDGAEQFYDCDSLTNVQSLGDILSLSNTMFWSCSNLTSVTLPSNIVQIPVKCFAYDSSLSTINLQNISAVYDNGLRQTSLATVSIGDLQNLTTIGELAFLQTQISGVLNLPNLTQIGSQAFDRCSRLTGIECLGKISNIPNSGVFNQTPITYAKIPYECTSIGSGAFYGCTNLTTIKQYNKSLSDYSEGETPVLNDISRVTTFGQECFYNCSLLQLDGSVLSNATSIGKQAFMNSGLYGSLNLSSLSGVIPVSAFKNTRITSVTIPQGVTEIQQAAFQNTDLTSITIPSSVTRCACNLVTETAVSEIIYPEGCTDIFDGQFQTKNNALTYVEIPSTATSMDFFFHRTLENSSDDLCTLVIKATTPPTVAYYKGGANSTKGNKFSGIYVPDASLTAYQSGADAWQHSSIQAKLKPISQLQTDNPTAWAKYNRTSTV